jgi:hypothetical protein
MMPFSSSSCINFIVRKIFNGLLSSGRNTTATLFLIWQEKRVPYGGRTSFDFTLSSEVLPFVTQIGVTLSVSGRISLMGSFILRSFLISCTLLGILPFLCLP